MHSVVIVVVIQSIYVIQIFDATRRSAISGRIIHLNWVTVTGHKIFINKIIFKVREYVQRASANEKVIHLNKNFSNKLEVLAESQIIFRDEKRQTSSDPNMFWSRKRF